LSQQEKFVSVGPATSLQKESGVKDQGEHLRTDHLLHNIGRRAVSGGFVTFGAQAIKVILNFTGAAVLARLLEPKDFGLVGMVMGVTALVGIFKELGLSTATVQREHITQPQVSNLFWINVAVGGIASLIGVGLSPLIAKFYRDPRVAAIMVVLSLTFLLTGSAVQHRALLTRQMRFSTVALIDVTAMFVGFLTGCILAWRGFGYWSLVAQQVSNSGTDLLLIWSCSRWRPNLPQRNTGVRPMLNFGAHITVADFVGRFSVSTDTILIGRFFGAAPLGLYTRATVLLQRPLEQVFTPVTAVLDPVLARLQNDPERYRRAFLRIYDGLAMVSFTFAALCLALAQPIVLVVLGPKWGGVIPLFSAFALVAISSPMSNVVCWIYQSQGRGRDQLHNHTWAGLITVAAYLLGLHWGPLGIVMSLAITSLVIRLPLVYYIAGRHGPVSTSDLWSGFFSQLPLWGSVYLMTMLAHMTFQNMAPILQLLVCAPVGFLGGIALMLPFRRSRENATYAWNMIRGTLLQRSSAI
jgi:O-antigen/teichoic acid export membrane protein